MSTIVKAPAGSVSGPRSVTPAKTVAALADQCVKCGLCLPHCPTYRLAGLEGESPRGRIALLQGLTGGRLELTAAAQTHLDNCLGCRACESVCPARVPYGELMDAGRSLLPSGAPPMLDWISRHPRATQWMMAGLGILRRLGLARLAPRSQSARPAWLWRTLRRLPLPARSRRLRPVYEPTAPERGTVYLFRGCVSQSMDGGTLDAAAQVLARLGYRVRVPVEQTCCGALHQHDGQQMPATRLAGRNCAAFGDGDEPILTTATGCAATLLDYGRLAPDRGVAVAGRTQDVCAFVAGHLAAAADDLQPQPLRVAVHLPCTARHVTGSSAAAVTLLEALPGVEVRLLDTAYGCCGAAGHHFLSSPAQADALLAPVLEEIRRIDPDVVATANIGCALHLGGALGISRPAPPVMHPITLVARGLGLAD